MDAPYYFSMSYVGSCRELHTPSVGYPLTAADRDPNNSRVMAGGATGLAKVWELTNPLLQRVFQGHHDQVQGLALSLDGRTLVSAASDGIRMWDVDSQKELTQLNPRPAVFTSCAISQDGRTLAVGDFGGLITLWNLASRQQVGTLRGHGEDVYEMAFLPDGTTLVSASFDQFRIWRAASAAETDANEAK